MPVFAEIVGQPRAVAFLEAAASRPVHAYLFVGPPGSGKRSAASAFAAALLCPAQRAGGVADGTCETCRRALAGIHPDVVSIERVGPYITIDMALHVAREASLSPIEGDRKVVILHDFHLVQHSAPALLKTIEEPPAPTIFVILADYLSPELTTIASRCVQVDFDALSPRAVVAALEASGVAPERAALLAEAAGGRLDRARLLASDEHFEARREAWRSVPARIDGTGATAARVADELIGHLEASVEPIKARHGAEMQDLLERNERAAEVVGSGRGKPAARATKAALNAGVADLEERHKRELRRQRTDELRAGLAALAGAYGERLGGDPRRRAGAVAAVGQIDQVVKDLEYNPGELLAVQALLVRLGRVDRLDRLDRADRVPR